MNEAQVRHYKNKAKQLFKEFKDGDAAARDRISAWRRDMEVITLMICQHVIAKEAGFNDWSDLIHSDTKEPS